MTPKEKAAELVEKFRLHNSSTQDENYKITRNYSIPLKHAIQCAIIAVEEISKAIPDYETDYKHEYDFWQSVLSELRELA